MLVNSDDPSKIMIKGNSTIGGGIQIKLQNITGGQIRIVSVSLDGQGFVRVQTVWLCGHGEFARLVTRWPVSGLLHGAA